MYKGKINVEHYPYCDNQVDACLPCPAGMIKSEPGDGPCLEVCDGESNVPNAAHTDCGQLIYSKKRMR